MCILNFNMEFALVNLHRSSFLFLELLVKSENSHATEGLSEFSQKKNASPSPKPRREADRSEALNSDISCAWRIKRSRK